MIRRHCFPYAFYACQQFYATCRRRRYYVYAAAFAWSPSIIRHFSSPLIALLIFNIFSYFFCRRYATLADAYTPCRHYAAAVSIAAASPMPFH